MGLIIVWAGVYDQLPTTTFMHCPLEYSKVQYDGASHSYIFKHGNMSEFFSSVVIGNAGFISVELNLKACALICS